MLPSDVEQIPRGWQRYWAAGLVLGIGLILSVLAFVAAPTPAYMAAHAGWLPWIAAFGVLLLTGMLVAYLITQANQRQRIQSLVEVRTQELRAEIAERQRLELELHRHLNRFRAVIESTSDLIFVKDLQGRYVQINPALSQRLGAPPDQIVGKTAAELFGEPLANPLAEHDQTVMTQGVSQAFEENISTPQGNLTTLVTKSPYRDPDGRIIGVIGIARDITERKRAEEDLRNFFDLSLDMLCTASPDGYFRRVSPAFERTLGYTPQEMFSQPFCDFVHPDDQERPLGSCNKRWGVAKSWTSRIGIVARTARIAGCSGVRRRSWPMASSTPWLAM